MWGFFGVHDFFGIALSLSPRARIVLDARNAAVYGGLLEESDVGGPDFEADVLFAVAESRDEDGGDFFVDGGEQLGSGTDDGSEQLRGRTANLVRGVFVVRVSGKDDKKGTVNSDI